MTVGEYITDRFQTFGVSLSEADLFDVTLSDPDISLETEITKENREQVLRAMTGIIPAILAMPESVNENGFSVQWDKSGLREYYRMLCNQLGIACEAGSSISDASHILYFLHKESPQTDSNGDTIPGTGKEEWVEVCRCRCDDNEASKTVGINGQAYVYRYHIVLSGQKKFSIGDRVRACYPNGELRGEGTIAVPGRCNFLGYSEIWI